MQTALPLANGFSRTGSSVKFWPDLASTSSRPDNGCLERPSGHCSPHLQPGVFTITAWQTRRIAHVVPCAIAIGQAELDDSAKALLRGHRTGFRLWGVAASTVALGLRVAHLAVRLAQLLVIQAQLRFVNQQQVLQQQLAEKRQKAESVQRERLRRLQAHASSVPFMRMLHSLSSPALSLETKWSEICKHIPAQEQLSDRLGQLFELSSQSFGSLQQAAIPGSRSVAAESQRKFFKSAHTQAVIDQEAAVKSLVFAQVLSANAQRQ